MSSISLRSIADIERESHTAMNMKQPYMDGPVGQHRRSRAEDKKQLMRFMFDREQKRPAFLSNSTLLFRSDKPRIDPLQQYGNQSTLEKSPQLRSMSVQEESGKKKKFDDPDLRKKILDLLMSDKQITVKESRTGDKNHSISSGKLDFFPYTSQDGNQTQHQQSLQTMHKSTQDSINGGLPTRHDYIPFLNERDSIGNLLVSKKEERSPPKWQKNLDLLKQQEKSREVPPIELDLDTVREWQEVSDMAVRLNVAENRYVIAGGKKVTPEENKQLEEGKEMEKMLEIDRRDRKRLEIYQEQIKQQSSVQSSTFERRSQSFAPKDSLDLLPIKEEKSRQSFNMPLQNAGSRLTGSSHMAYLDQKRVDKGIVRELQPRAITKAQRHSQVPDLNTYGSAILEKQNIQTCQPKCTKSFLKAIGHTPFIMRSEEERQQGWFQNIGMDPVSSLKESRLPNFVKQQDRDSISFLKELDKIQKARIEEAAEKRYMHMQVKMEEQETGQRRAKQEKYVFNLPVQIRKYHPSRVGKLSVQYAEGVLQEFEETSKMGLRIGQRVRNSIRKQKDEVAEMKERDIRNQIEEQMRSKQILKDNKA